MPLISQFYGILIYIYKELGGHHNEPHIELHGDEIKAAWNVYNNDGEILKIKGLE